MDSAGAAIASTHTHHVLRCTITVCLTCSGNHIAELSRRHGW